MKSQGEPVTVIVASSSDLASRTLAEALISDHGFTSTGISLLGEPVYQKGALFLSFFEGSIVNPPDLDSYFNPQAYVFLSRHSAESRIPSLTAHVPGNFSEAKAGGNPGELARGDAGLLKDYMIALSRRAARVPSYKITVEATHHGPTSLSKPVLFVELGSSEEQWGDGEAAKVVAESLVECLKSRNIWEKVAVGFGGTHYPEKLSEAVVNGEFAVSFIAPKYALEHVDEKMVRQMIQKTNAPVRYAMVDWKGLGPHKERIIKLVSQLGLEVVRV